MDFGGGADFAAGADCGAGVDCGGGAAGREGSGRGADCAGGGVAGRSLRGASGAVAFGGGDSGVAAFGGGDFAARGLVAVVLSAAPHEPASGTKQMLRRAADFRYRPKANAAAEIIIEIVEELGFVL